MMAKKLVERNRLLSLLKCLELEHLKPEDTEGPDFLIPSGTHRIGVEVTRLVSNRAPNQDNPSQASRVLDDLVGRILAQYTQLGGPPVNASLKFRDGLRAREHEEMMRNTQPHVNASPSLIRWTKYSVRPWV